MLNFTLSDKNLLENFEAATNLRNSGLFTDEEINEMYQRQLEKDKEVQIEQTTWKKLSD